MRGNRVLFLRAIISPMLVCVGEYRQAKLPVDNIPGPPLGAWPLGSLINRPQRGQALLFNFSQYSFPSI